MAVGRCLAGIYFVRLLGQARASALQVRQTVLESRKHHQKHQGRPCDPAGSENCQPATSGSGGQRYRVGSVLGQVAVAAAQPPQLCNGPDGLGLHLNCDPLRAFPRADAAVGCTQLPHSPAPVRPARPQASDLHAARKHLDHPPVHLSCATCRHTGGQLGVQGGC
jgi:hypothetical protein